MLVKADFFLEFTSNKEAFIMRTIHAFFVILLWTLPAFGQTTYTVVNNNDAGAGSLREAIDQANTDSVESIVLFDSSLSGAVIDLLSSLTLAEGQTTVNGDIDGDGIWDIILQGTSGDAIKLESENNLIQGLAIQGFGDAIEVREGNNVIFRNRITQNNNAVRLFSAALPSTTVSQNSITNNGSGLRGASGFSVTAFFDASMVLSGLTDPGLIIEAFSDSGLQGNTYLSSATSDSEGEFSLDLSGFNFAGLLVNLTATDSAGGTKDFTHIVGHQILVAGNRWAMQLNNFASWGYDLDAGNVGGEFPAGSGNFLIFAGGSAVAVLADTSASDLASRIAISESLYGGDFAPGEITNENVAFGQLAAAHTFGRPVFSIDASQQGFYYDGWPSELGAPADASGNPLLVSDLDTWSVFNDVDTSIHFDDGGPLGIGIEVQRQTYQFNSTTLPGAENTTIVRRRITNKTNVTYPGTYFGFWCDADLGTAANDLAGTDSVRNMMYYYNASAESTPTGNQYAVGIKLLYDSENGGINARIKNTALTSSSSFPPGISTELDLYHYMLGLDADGSVRLASEGHVEMDGDPFMFPGDPVTGTGLTSVSLHPGGSDFRGWINVGPINFEPLQTVDLIYAVIGGEGADRLAAITDMRAEADNFETLFADDILPLMNTDVTAPSITMGVLQNPEESLSGFLDIYLSADEPLAHADVQYSVDAAAGSLDMALLSGSDNVYFSDLDLDNTGTLSLSANVRDLAGNLASSDKLYTVSKVPAGKSGTARSPDNRLELYFPKDFAASDLFVVIGEEDNPDFSKDYIAASPAYRIGPADYVNDVGLGLTISPNVEQAGEEAGSNTALFRFDNGAWEQVGGTLQNGRLEVNITKFGTYRLLVRKDGIVPDRFALKQNFPNPFNPATTIRYDVPVDTRVNLSVFNVLGQKVRTLVNTLQPANSYEIQWDGRNDYGVNVSSGIYIYRIHTADFVKTRKMMLIR